MRYMMVACVVLAVVGCGKAKGPTPQVKGTDPVKVAEQPKAAPVKEQPKAVPFNRAEAEKKLVGRWLMQGQAKGSQMLIDFKEDRRMEDYKIHSHDWTTWGKWKLTDQHTLVTSGGASSVMDNLGPSKLGLKLEGDKLELSFTVKDQFLETSKEVKWEFIRKKE